MVELILGAATVVLAYLYWRDHSALTKLTDRDEQGRFVKREDG